MKDNFVLFIDFAPTKNCKNEYSYGSTCLKCNKCGRFDNMEEDDNEDNISQGKRSNKNIRKQGK